MLRDGAGNRGQGRARSPIGRVPMSWWVGLAWVVTRSLDVGAVVERGPALPAWCELAQEQASLRELQQPPSLETYQGRISRDPFFEQRAIAEDVVEDRFTLRDIHPIPHPIVFQGYLELPDGRLLGQVNVDRRTALVELEEVVAGYQVTGISKAALDVRTPGGESLRLPYRTPVVSGAFEATLHDRQAQATLTVRKGFEGQGFRVVEVTAEHVVLWTQRRTVTLRAAAP